MYFPSSPLGNSTCEGMAGPSSEESANLGGGRGSFDAVGGHFGCGFLLGPPPPPGTAIGLFFLTAPGGGKGFFGGAPSDSLLLDRCGYQFDFDLGSNENIRGKKNTYQLGPVQHQLA